MIPMPIKMDLFQYLFVLLFLVYSCAAGPLIALAARAAKAAEGGAAGTIAARKILESQLAARFGVGVRELGYGWVDRAVIIDKKLYYGPPIIGGGALAAVGGGVAGGVVAGNRDVLELDAEELTRVRGWRTWLTQWL